MLSPDTGRLRASRLITHLRSTAASMSPSERRVVQVFLQNTEAVVGWSVLEVAAEAGSSTATVVRTCQRLGFTGYQQLRTELARVAGEPEVNPASDGLLGQVPRSPGVVQQPNARGWQLWPRDRSHGQSRCADFHLQKLPADSPDGAVITSALYGLHALDVSAEWNGIPIRAHVSGWLPKVGDIVQPSIRLAHIFPASNPTGVMEAGIQPASAAVREVHA
jgi:Helix-turn-helix domain, rpiR family